MSTIIGTINLRLLCHGQYMKFKHGRHWRIWHSEDRASWYIRILEANEIHYFSSYFDKQLYMFRTDLLSIISSLDTVFTASGICLLAGSQHTSMTNTSCCEYSIKTPDDGQQVCPKHVELFIEIQLRNSASCWLALCERHWRVNRFSVYVGGTQSPWRLRQHLLPKCHRQPTVLQGIKTYKTVAWSRTNCLRLEAFAMDCSLGCREDKARLWHMA